jgi:hypothetical protein
MTTLLKWKCLTCVHYFEHNKCTAFPDGIPFDIVEGEFKHTKRHPEQKNDIFYESETK